MGLEELYREVIIDHFRNPRHRTPLDSVDAHAEGNNPLCGDRIELDLALANGTVTGVATRGQGCSISQASASMMSNAISGKTMEEISELAATFKAMMTTDEQVLDEERPGSVLGDLEALQGVRRFPVRIKCANLAWAALEQALAGESNSATTSE
ncbi:MAG: SUF system NifU family Fe-S cluster assembly protein [Acidimicrobiia bacterium]|nr:SUF system NifU family Fe-S cluster assembly protein [Acidimicrobiia bacterium]